MSEPETFANRLEADKKAIDKARNERTRAEATKEQLEKQQEGILAEIQALGVKPENLDATITELETGIANDLQQLEALIPVEYRTA